MSASTLLAILREKATTHAHQVAYWTPYGEWTFAELNEASNRIARALADLGVVPGDRVATLSKHTVHTVLLWLAAVKLGAVCMPVNWRLTAREAQYILNDGRARFLMADGEFASTVAALECPDLRQCCATLHDAAFGPALARWSADQLATDPGHEPSMPETALQLYSSGTTGLPKGVELSHGNLAANLAVLPDALRYYGAPSVMLNALPAFHIAGIGVALVTAALGGRLVLYPEFDPPTILAAIGRHRITHSFFVPAMIQFLLREPDLEQYDFSSLQGISYGASPITESVLTTGMRVFGCGFTQVYGLTETTGAVTVLHPEDHQTDGERHYLLRSAGEPMRGVTLRIVDPETGQDQAPGKVGEVWIRSLQNMSSYWNAPEATAKALVPDAAGPPHWFRSGDAGYLQNGFLFLHDRIKDMIISGGENIYPAEVENVLMQHPDIIDGAVIGVPDERWGETVKAIIVPRPGTTPDEAALIAWMRERLAHFKCPSSITIAEQIPRNPSGKILKRVLREPYWPDSSHENHSGKA